MCDGLFLIQDTAKHNGFTPDPQEVVEHISGCAECSSTADAYDEWAELIFDPDTGNHPWDTLHEVNGHA